MKDVKGSYNRQLLLYKSIKKEQEALASCSPQIKNTFYNFKISFTNSLSIPNQKTDIQ